jgi:hypothetical protein
MTVRSRSFRLLRQRGGGLRSRQQVRSEPVEQLPFSLSAAAQVEHRHPTRSQHERPELFRLPETSRPKGFQRRHENLLREILRRLRVPQVTQPVEPNARSHACEELRLGFAVGSGGDSPRQLGILQVDFHQHTLYV